MLIFKQTAPRESFSLTEWQNMKSIKFFMTALLLTTCLSSSHQQVHSVEALITSIQMKRMPLSRNTKLLATQQDGSNQERKYLKRKKKQMTVADLKKELLQNAGGQVGTTTTTKHKEKKYKRTRRRVEKPQQKYIYAAQRNKLQNQNLLDTEAEEKDARRSFQDNSNIYLMEANKMGLVNPSGQHCEALVDTIEPKILGQIRVGDEEGNISGHYAYLIYKPQGWAILGRHSKKSSSKTKETQSSKDIDEELDEDTNEKTKMKRIGIKNSTRGDEIEFDENDVLALLTPEDRSEMEGRGFDLAGPVYDDEDDLKSNIPGWYDVENMTPEERHKACIDGEDYDPSDILDFDESDVLALLSTEEREAYESNKENQNRLVRVNKSHRVISRDDLDPSAAENLKRIKARSSQKSQIASFSSFQRPSIVSWLKEKMLAEGNPIRGGKFWTAHSGATDVDDSGVVLLVPKEKLENIFVENTEYVAVVGNGKCLNPTTQKDGTRNLPRESVSIDMISRLKRNREGDIVQTLRVVVTEQPSSCRSIVHHIQNQFEDGIRGDPEANPFDRRAPRRLIHCKSMAISSLVFDESSKAETTLPDDIAVLSDRIKNHKFREGSFLGRHALRNNPLTTAYREINGAADGFPGWMVDRYGSWLLVQHNEKESRGPLPSIHDGYTAGVYLLPSTQDRGAMGSADNIRPCLLEGKPAPDIIPVKESGITYHVSLDRDLSTGIFLDQRQNRAWLSRYCNADTRVLNCFAHCGAFSIAAATAGASTVSLDLNKKWLDRIPPQLEANGIEFNERHDCIYGDCFEWLEKLRKRGEKFDLVILDPPSSSIGRKKKRWSVKNDMNELVELAAPLVKNGGLLWTTTNSASLTPLKFAEQCQKGFESAGIHSAKLERIQPMPVDFPSIGPQTVKNYVWRII